MDNAQPDGPATCLVQGLESPAGTGWTGGESSFPPASSVGGHAPDARPRTCRSQAPPLPRWKRTLDLAGAVTGLVLLSPVLVLTTVFLKVAAGGPVFFRQQRYGLHGRPFLIWKFRTMRGESNALRHQQYVQGLLQADQTLAKMDHQFELVPLGGWLRRSALDELPQLLNVLRGEMSLVGPRPDVIPPEEYAPWQQPRFDAVPGMTGLWQVSGKNQTSFSDMIRLDLAYIRRRSLAMDVAILLRTVACLFRRALRGGTA